MAGNEPQTGAVEETKSLCAVRIAFADHFDFPSRVEGSGQEFARLVSFYCDFQDACKSCVSANLAYFRVKSFVCVKNLFGHFG